MNPTLDYYERTAADLGPLTQVQEVANELPMFAAGLEPGGRLLDAGCGAGRDLKFFLEAGLLAEGLEPSPALAQMARDWTSEWPEVVVQEGTFDDWHPEETSYDGIWAHGSIAHVPLADLPALLVKMGQALKPRAMLYVAFRFGTQEQVDPDTGVLWTDMDETRWNALIGQTQALRVFSTSVSAPRVDAAGQTHRWWMVELSRREARPELREPSVV